MRFLQVSAKQRVTLLLLLSVLADSKLGQRLYNFCCVCAPVYSVAVMAKTVG